MVAALAAGIAAPTAAVRVNAVDTPHCHRDIVAVVGGAGASVDVVVLPKVDDPSHVTFADHLLSALEAELGLPRGRIGLEAQIESARGLVAAEAIAASCPARLEALVLGPGDLAASLGMPQIDDRGTRARLPGRRLASRALARAGGGARGRPPGDRRPVRGDPRPGRPARRGRPRPRSRSTGLDVLVNNAGIARRASGASMTEALDGPSVLEVFDTNAVGIVRVSEAALPLLARSANPVVVNVSSALGSFWATHEPTRPASHFVSIVYGASKAAVSMLTVQYARAHPEMRINAVEPGITATELGGGDPGSHPGRPAAESARVVARLATIDRDGPTGTFQEDDGELGW